MCVFTNHKVNKVLSRIKKKGGLLYFPMASQICFQCYNKSFLWTFLAGKPSTPGVPEAAKVGRTSVDLQWDKPRNDGGSKLTGTVQIRGDNLTGHNNAGLCTNEMSWPL